MPKWAWVSVVVIGSFLLIGGQFRCTPQSPQNQYINAAITSQPASQTVIAPATATFSVQASGTAPINYQWYLNGTAINGATQSSYTTPATTVQMSGGAYTVEVWQPSGPAVAPAYSNQAVLTVDTASTPNVYAGGYAVASGSYSTGTSGAVPGYWLNGTWYALPVLSDELGTNYAGNAFNSQVNALAAGSGGDIYAAGDNINSSSIDVPGYWLNGTWHGLPPLDAAQNSSVQSLAVAEGNIVYAAGYSTDSSGIAHPGYWKIGADGTTTWTTLTFNGGQGHSFSAGQVNSISVVGNESSGLIVYAAGVIIDTNSNYWPCLWIDASLAILQTPTEISQGGPDEQYDALSLLVDGGTIYVAGYILGSDGISQIPGYWTVQIGSSHPPQWNPLTVPAGWVIAQATGITLTSGNLIVVGNVSSLSPSVAYSVGVWANGTWQPWLTGTYPGPAVESLVVSGGNTYAGGCILASGVLAPGYWMDYSWVGLPPLDPTQNAVVNSILIAGGFPTIVAPSSLTYSPNPATYTVGTQIPPNTPSISGSAVGSYSVNPALPAGLSLDPVTGIITGTPSAAAAVAPYTVTATNLAGQTTASLSITVNAAATQPPASLTYLPNPAIYTVNVTIAANTPSSSGGAVASYGVSPPLPTGLTLDPGTGIITGTPTVVTPMATYVVTATNAAGHTTCNLTITVSAVSTLTAELALPPFVHPNDTWMQASVLPAPDGLTYLWTLPPGTSSGSISSGQGTNVIAFAAGSSDGDFQVQVNVQNGSGGNVTVQRTVTVQNGTWLVEDGGPATARTGATATLLPSGRVLVAGGETNFYNALASAEIYDPATGRWFTTGAMETVREHHTATLLADGTVLVAGGYDGAGNLLDSAEIFDPATGTWTPTSNNLTTARGYHTATLLPGGNVLVVGGQGQSGTLASGEIYSPATGQWSLSNGHLATARYSHTATLLSNQTVLVAGGSGPSELSSAEIYTPGSDSWAATGSMAAARSGHTATLLYNNAVLAVGGNGASSLSLASAEIYNYVNGTWSTTGSMSTARTFHTATLLTDGTVLAVGGQMSFLDLASAEVYNSTNGTWSSTGSLNLARYSHTATLLTDGTVLVAGGNGLASTTLASSEIYTPSPTSTWSVTGARGSVRHLHTATLLPGGNVLVAGGVDDSGTALATSYIYNPATRIWSVTGTMNTARYSHTATLLGDGTVLVAGGRNLSGGAVGTGEIYDPSTGNWSPITNGMVTARYGHTATLLGNGTVLVAGGDGSLGALTSCEIYNRMGQTWTATGSLNAARVYHTATLVGGQVLAAGGQGTGVALDSAEIFNGATWSTVGNMTTGREYHTATLLADGVTVLLAGGNGSGASTVASAELYDSTAKTFSTTGSMLAARQYHTATLLPNGMVLVAGGWAYTGGLPVTLAGAEIYDPASGVQSWSATGPLGTARYSHTAILLNDGTVLVSFGEYADVVSEIYLP